MTRVIFRPGVILESYRNYQKDYWLRKQHSERLCWYLVNGEQIEIGMVNKTLVHCCNINEYAA